jgi:hypothetical protein
MRKFLWLFPVILVTSSCSSPEQIESNNLRDKVLACGLDFHNSLSSSLGYNVDKHHQNGKFSAGFEEGVEGIFSELPPKDREKAYEQYIKCISTLKITYPDAWAKPPVAPKKV